MPQVSIIIINYNTFNLTTKCIQSIYNKTSGLSFEVILVDNASIECEALIFKQQFPDIILIKSEKNLGFAKGNNLGIQQASGDYILLLNSDTALTENSIKIVYEKSLLIKNLGAATVKLIYPDGEVQPAAGYLPNMLLLLLEVTRLSRIFKKFYNRYRPVLNYNKSFVAEWIWGTFFFFPKKNLELLGGKLSETFFMYGEDVEWSYLFNINNLQNYYFADSTVIHHSGKSIYKSRNAALTKNARKFVRKYYGNFSCIVFIILTGVSNFIENTKKKVHISGGKYQKQ